MDNRRWSARPVLGLGLVFLLLSVSVAAQATAAADASDGTWKLPKPKTAGKPLMQILEKRCSQRDFRPDPLPDQVLAELLWAAVGINRPASGKRTSPTAMNSQEIDVYVALAKGLYRYDPVTGDLKLVLKEDLRAQTGKQPFVKDAPVNLIFVADFSKFKSARGAVEDSLKQLYSAMDAGFVSQNVYLYCAAEGLATVVRAWVDKEALKAAMKLPPEQQVVLTQTVGYPQTGGAK